MLSHEDKRCLDLAGNHITKVIKALDESHSLPMATFNDPRGSSQKPWKQAPLRYPFDARRFRPFGKHLITFRAQNTAGYGDLTDQLGDGDSKVLFMALVLVTSAYGAIHLTAGHTIVSTQSNSRTGNHPVIYSWVAQDLPL